LAKTITNAMNETNMGHSLPMISNASIILIPILIVIQ
jgi:hypothetical protein